jgi:S-adenosylmethionine decarboxylase
MISLLLMLTHLQLQHFSSCVLSIKALSAASPVKAGANRFLPHSGSNLLVGESAMLNDALFQLGTDLDACPRGMQRSNTQTEVQFEIACEPKAVNDNFGPVQPGINDHDGRLDHFIMRDGMRCAGSHLIIDLYDAERLNDQAYIEETMLDCVKQAGATLLHIHLHPFEPTGVSGVAVLAESHISVHTWPETGYAAFDVFMCGDARPELCVDILRKAFNAKRVGVSELLRGREV